MKIQLAEAMYIYFAIPAIAVGTSFLQTAYITKSSDY